MNILSILLFQQGPQNIKKWKTAESFVFLLQSALKKLLSTFQKVKKLRTGDSDLRFYITTVQDG